MTTPAERITRHVPGPKPMYRIDRTRVDRGAACGCGWRSTGANRQRAMQHARQKGHRVTFIVEEITTYTPGGQP